MKDNILYIDESNTKLDNNNPLVIGGFIIRKEDVKDVISNIKTIKSKHNIKSLDEIKWTKTNAKTYAMYSEIIDYIQNSNKLFFRALVAKKPDDIKVGYDSWITRLHHTLISKLTINHQPSSIVADRRSKTQMAELVSTIKIISKQRNTDIDIQYLDSKDSLMIQLSDLFLGAVMFANSDIDKIDNYKSKLTKQIQEKWNIKKSSSIFNKKYSIFFWGYDNE